MKTESWVSRKLSRRKSLPLQIAGVGIVAFAAIVAIFFQTPAYDWRYSRADCLVKVKIEWTVPDNERFKIFKTIGRSLAELHEKAGTKPGIDRGPLYHLSEAALYLQYRKQCEDRFEITDDLLERLKMVVDDKVVFHLLRERIEPGPDSVDLKGPFWTDGF